VGFPSLPAPNSKLYTAGNGLMVVSVKATCITECLGGRQFFHCSIRVVDLEESLSSAVLLPKVSHTLRS
jgi:hypothetical protein